MTEVISIKFRACGRQYFFDPGELKVAAGQKVIVETAKGLEIADCSRGNHMVEDTAVVQPLRSVVRIATEQDIRTAEQMGEKEKDAFDICKKKIAEHGLDMKLVSAECSFEGNKTMFFFTSEGRVDFRELVRDLAGIFHNRIELRQIGVRDEARMIGGIAICGRPYCCGEFLDDFAPVSTKMAKVQSLSLNPAKISGSCGRLMCCLRYEEEAYEDLVKRVPKQGAFVQTRDGYGTVEQINLLRQYVKVRLDNSGEAELHQYDVDEIAVFPDGRPQEGEPYPDLLKDIPQKVKEELLPEEKDLWASPALFADARDVWTPPSSSLFAPSGSPAFDDLPGTEEETVEPSSRHFRETRVESPHRNGKRGKPGQGKPEDRPAENRQKKERDKIKNSGQNTDEKQRTAAPGQNRKKKPGAKQGTKNSTGKSGTQKDEEIESGRIEKLQHGNRPENGGKKKENRFPTKKDKRNSDAAREISNKPKSREFGVAPVESAEKKQKDRRVSPDRQQDKPEYRPETRKENISEGGQAVSAEGTGAPAKKRYYGNRHRYYGNHGGHGSNGGNHGNPGNSAPGGNS